MKEHECSIAILCGGRSSRFGMNKCFHIFRGKELFVHIYDRLRHLSGDIFIQGHPRDESPEPLSERYGIPVYEDRASTVCALGGIHSALKNAVHDHVFVVACDMPYIRAELVEILMSQLPKDAVVPRWHNGFLEPLSAIYSRHLVERTEYSLNRGDLRISSLLSSDIRVKYVAIEPLMEAGAIPPNTFLNINSASDLNGVK